MANSFADTTLPKAQANTLAAIKIQVADLNVALKADYLTVFDNWLQNRGKTSAVEDPPKPPNAFVVGSFVDPTSGPGSGGFYGDLLIRWATPAVGHDQVCDMPAIPAIVPSSGGIANKGPSQVGDPMNDIPGAPDELYIGAEVWRRFRIPTPWGMAVGFRRVV